MVTTQVNVPALENQPISILIVNIRPSPKLGAVVAYVDVKVGPTTLYGLSVVRNKNGGYFVGLPVRFGTNGNKTFPLVEIDEPFRGEVIKAVLRAAEEFMNFGE